MYCPTCGVEIPAQAPSCGRCGTALPRTCGQCATSLPAGSKFCPACGHPVAADGNSENVQVATAAAESPGERKLVTVLFADLAGFTAFSSERDPEEVKEFLTGLWARLDAVITAAGG